MKKAINTESGMDEAWEDRRRIKEEEYFKKMNEEALQTLKSSQENSLKAASSSRNQGQRNTAGIAQRLIRFFHLWGH